MKFPRELTLRRYTTIDNPPLNPPHSIFTEFKTESNPEAQFLQYYDPLFYKHLRHKFPGAKNIRRSFSAAMHDMFVLSALDGKKNGTYVEIGGGLAIHGNNTYLLESQFDWKGISFDIDRVGKVDLYNKVRNNPCFCENATTIDVERFFSENNLERHIDYLQIDIEPASQSLAALKNIPLDDYSFSIIQFEHEFCHNADDTYANEAYKYLSSYGYKRAIKNLGTAEDWYYNPKTTDPTIMAKLVREETLNRPYELGYDTSKGVYVDNFLWGHETIMDLPHDLSSLIDFGYKVTSEDLQHIS